MMIRRPWAVGLALITLAACAARTLAPERVPLDRAHCARCDMIVSNEASAAQAVSPTDETRFYDDIGCLSRDPAARDARLRLFVHERDGARWLAVEEAFFASPAGYETPMAHGIAAYATEAAARRADRDGHAYRWADVARAAEARR